MATPLLGQALQGGSLPTLSPNASKEEQTSVINDIVNHLNNSLQTQVYADGVSKRLLIGFQKGGWDGGASDFGIKMSIAGQDVTTASDTQLLFTMSMNSWIWRNSSGILIKKYDSTKGNETFYDPSNGLDIGQQGILPDGTGGAAWAKPGNSVNNGFGY